MTFFCLTKQELKKKILIALVGHHRFIEKSELYKTVVSNCLNCMKTTETKNPDSTKKKKKAKKPNKTKKE